ncbi:MAG: hypothetical protein ABIK36_08915 [Pseudomonadota bacterium]
MTSGDDTTRSIEVASTLGLGGDGDELDVLEAVEKSFDIKILDHEAEFAETVGQLFDIVMAKASVDPDARRCATAMVFYRLRCAIGDPTMSPHSKLDEIVSHTPRQLYRRLAQETGLAMPSGSTGRLGSVCLYAMIFLVPAALVTIVAGWTYWPVVTLLAVSAAVLFWLDARRWHGESLGEVSRKVAHLNFARLANLGARSAPIDAWAAYAGLLSDITGVDAGRIARETRFI